MVTKKDITQKEDIEVLINSFYDKVKIDPTIGYIFSDIAKVNWEEHLPVMYQFWGALLLDEKGYSGNPMEKHIALSRKTKLEKKEFDTWLFIFQQTIDELFEGDKAEEAKKRAMNIANLMLYKIEQIQTTSNK